MVYPIPQMKKKQFKSLYPRETVINERPINYCGIRCSLEVLGGKWKLLILAELSKGSSRYSVLKDSIPEISEKMLIESLKELEANGIVSKMENEKGKTTYALSPYGISVLPLLKTLYEWGENHIHNYSHILFH